MRLHESHSSFVKLPLQVFMRENEKLSESQKPEEEKQDLLSVSAAELTMLGD